MAGIFCLLSSNLTRKIALSALLLVLIFFIFTPRTHGEGSFGITPPYVTKDNLTRYSVYEQKIIIVRSNPTTDLKASISWEVPGADEWISIDNGTEFLLPAGEKKVPMTVRVEVPRRASFKNYSGRLWIRTSPVDGAEKGRGAVRIALGAQVDVDLTVIDKKIFDFEVRRVKISDLNEGRKLWWLDFPGKINFTMTIANRGNVAVAPAKVKFSIYDFRGEKLLEETFNTNKLRKVDPFLTKEVSAQLPTHLPAGSYSAHYFIYDHEGKVKSEGKVNISILPQGTLDGSGEYGFAGLSLADKTSILLPIFAILALGGMLVIRRVRRKSAVVNEL